MNHRYQFLVVFVLFSAIINLFAADVCEYSKQDLMREQRSMEYSAQELREIAGLLMGMDFQHSEKDVAYMKELPLYQNQLLQSFLHRWRKTRQHKANYIKLLSGGEREPEPSALKKIFWEKLEEHCTKGTASAVFLSDLADQVAVHKGLYDAEEVDELVAYFPKIRSNMLKNSFFYILLANGFFLQKELPSLYSENLNSMLFDMTNVLRKRLKLSLLRPGESSNSN